MPTPMTAAADTATTAAPEQQEAGQSRTTADPENGRQNQSTPNGAEPQNPETPGQTIEIEDIVKEGDEYIFRGDKNDPNALTYKGKTLAELIGNIAKGLTEKEKHIRTLEAESKARNAGLNRRIPETAGDPEPPKWEAIVDKRQAEGERMATARGLEPRMLGWGIDEWETYQQSKDISDLRINRMMTAAEQINGKIERSARQEYDQQNTAYVNGLIINEETEEVEGLLTESGIDPGKFDYETILERVYNDPKNRTADGRLKNGRIAAAASRELMRLQKEAQKPELQKSLLAKAKEIEGGNRGKIISGGGAGGPAKTEPKRFKSYDEALDDARKK